MPAKTKPLLNLTPALQAGPWTLFWDMHSGGGQKLDWAKIYIQLPRADAIDYFRQRFDRDPYNVTCDCCGEDYSIVEHDDLIAAAGFHCNFRWDNDANGYVPEPRGSKYASPIIPLADYINREDVLVIPATEIKPRQYIPEIPNQ